MKKVLMVAYYFPPIATSGAMRPLGFCRHLPSFGWQPRVIAVDPMSVSKTMPVDAELATRIPDGIRVDRPGHPNRLDTLIQLRNRLTRRTRGTSALPVSRATSNQEPMTGLSQVKELLLEHTFLVPDAQRSWRSRAVRSGIGGQRPDVVYATGGPWTALLAGRDLASHFRVPFIADFRDPWTRNPMQKRSPSALARSRRLERAVCRSATIVIANTIELREQLTVDYPEMAAKFIAIHNGFDSSAVDQKGPEPPADPGRPLELVHFGTIYGNRTPAPLLTAVCRLVDSGRLPPPRLRIRFIGSWELDENDPSTKLARRLESAGVVTREPSVAHQDCLALMRRAGTLLVLQAASPLQIPGKIYEYVSAGRPLLLVGGEGATAALVERERLGRCCPNDVNRIENVLMELLTTDAQAPRVEEAARFDYRHLTGRLAATLDAALHENATSSERSLEKNVLQTLDGLK